MGQGMSVKEAAIALGISQNAIRKRIERGTLASSQVGGRWVVYLEEDNGDQPGDYNGDPEATQIVQLLREEVAFLRDELQRKDQLLLHLVQHLEKREALP